MKSYTRLVSLALGLACVAASASAGELMIHGPSLHTKAKHSHTETTRYVTEGGILIRTETVTVEKRYNNFNPGIAYTFDNGVQLGGYYNSYERATLYVAKEWMFTDRWGALLGVGTGYEVATGHKIAVLGALQYKYPLSDSAKLVTQFVPPSGRTAGLVHLGISRPF